MHQIKCHCGQVHGHVLPGGPSSRVKCYCSDCQAFGRYFGEEAQVLDAQGGAELVQVCQSRLRFEKGIEHLAILRLTEKGMLRWYAQCCRTPIGNTMSDRKMSFIGLIHTCLDKSAIDTDFGKQMAMFSTAEATGEPKPQQRGVFTTILRFLRLVLMSRLLGRYKKSPLFRESGEPITIPCVLSADELRLLKKT